MNAPKLRYYKEQKDDFFTVLTFTQADGLYEAHRPLHCFFETRFCEDQPPVWELKCSYAMWFNASVECEDRHDLVWQIFFHINDIRMVFPQCEFSCDVSVHLLLQIVLSNPPSYMRIVAHPDDADLYVLSNNIVWCTSFDNLSTSVIKIYKNLVSIVTFLGYLQTRIRIDGLQIF